ncbi:hypothetical protein VTP01DRAFT_2304 [Rhizomucor pusillus]|uniref:uncharacterized protein n=1 Tax=Rhizomucor pusillus TaxID=4840 RepID=UPI00374217B1
MVLYSKIPQGATHFVSQKIIDTGLRMAAPINVPRDYKGNSTLSRICSGLNKLSFLFGPSTRYGGSKSKVYIQAWGTVKNVPRCSAKQASFFAAD